MNDMIFEILEVNDLTETLTKEEEKFLDEMLGRRKFTVSQTRKIRRLYKKVCA